MNYNTFLLRFGLNPDNFKQQEVSPIKTDSGYIYYLEQTNAKKECPYCGRNQIYVKGYYNEKINVTINANETDIFAIKRIRFKCRYCNKTYSPKIEGVSSYSQISNSVKDNIVRDLFKKLTYKEIANRYDVSVPYVIKLFDDYFNFVPRNELSEVVCIDEFHFSKVYDQNYCCVLCDYNNKRIIDVIKNRQKAYLNEYFDRFSSVELSNVHYYISDMYDEYKIIRKKYFPNAIHIIDLFHIITQMTTTINVLRTKAMKHSVSQYSMEYNFMKKNWKCFLCRSDRIPNKTYTYMKTGECYTYYDLVYKCIKTDNALSIGYGVLQDLFTYSKKKTEIDINNFIDFICARLIDSGYLELIKVGNTYKKWKSEIANAFSKEARERGLTNATAEGMNNQIKTIIKIAYGFENFDRFRRRIMLIYAHQSTKNSSSVELLFSPFY